MKPTGRGYFLKEYGSWSVLLIAFITGLAVSRAFPWQALPVLLALGLLVNSKQAYMKWSRQPAERKHLWIFLLQVAAAATLLIVIYGRGVPQLLPLLVVSAAYLLSNRLAGEHYLLTEVLGFALLSLAAVLAKFLVVEGVDVRLFVATALYFSAGVFKIKALLFKKRLDRVLTVVYILFSAYLYGRFALSLLILLPLVENIVTALTLYKVRLQTTGWIEVAKSIAFLVLMVQLF